MGLCKYATGAGNVISAAVGLVYNVQPEYELPSSTRFRQYQKFGKKLSWVHCHLSHVPLKKTFLHGV